MDIVFVVVAAVVVFAVAAAAVGHGDGLEEPFPDMERPYLPQGRVEPVDVDDVHFAVAFRGYRMDQVDTVLDRLTEQLAERDQHIARLERIVQSQAVRSVESYTPSRPGLDTGPIPVVTTEPAQLTQTQQPAATPQTAEPLPAVAPETESIEPQPADQPGPHPAEGEPSDDDTMP